MSSFEFVLSFVFKPGHDYLYFVLCICRFPGFHPAVFLIIFSPDCVAENAVCKSSDPALASVPAQTCCSGSCQVRSEETR